MEHDPLLNVNEQTLRIFVKDLPSPVAMLDNNMRYLLVSDRWLKDYNLGDKNIIGMTHYEVFPDINNEWKELHRRCLNGETLRNDNDSFVRSDGTTDYIRWEIVPWYNQAGSIGGMIILSEVVTKLHKLEEELKNRILELEIENKAMIGREMKMVELKKELEELKKSK